MRPAALLILLAACTPAASNPNPTPSPSPDPSPSPTPTPSPSPTPSAVTSATPSASSSAKPTPKLGASCYTEKDCASPDLKCVLPFDGHRIIEGRPGVCRPAHEPQPG